ncbi:D-2-hydroxyacid dehydrogenase [Brachybacterium alimentarium]|uniref:D-2-hydroxyacid dehydrogenase n=1 Tax=Brachybacterium alimentarium TaxID=47845 RepID=UPI000DF1E9DD|nr:D-2-hydroxyacid dehydrogenase [Brachybacterium alimentarium]RCS67456.1 D-2-hydroxyacid dehydrogenase [Brachybacterium alimentarium]RCS85043.1 D-2-hydroxyacid dehydrogenase [Brachybacterium alimentarium]
MSTTRPAIPQTARPVSVEGSGEAGGRPRVVIAVDLPEELCRTIEEAEPRVDVIRDHGLYRPRRGPADWAGDPEHVRGPEEQAAYDDMVDSADVLFSLPDVDPSALRRTADANSRLRWVQAMAAGGGSQVKAAGLDAAALKRITVTTTAGVHGRPLAEFALFGVLAGAKTLPQLTAQQREHEWSDRWEMRHLDEMTVLVVGLGGIGAACAALFSAAGAHVLGTTRSGTPVEGVDELIPADELALAAARADAIVVTLPGTAATDGLVGADVLAAAKPGVIVVNVGRGTVIDEPALVDALTSGQVGFAALDVFATEPLPTTSPLWDHPRVLVSPHTAALSSREEERIVRLFVDNLGRFLDGGELRNVVDTVEFY